MKLTLDQTLEFVEAFSSNTPLKRGNHVPAVYCRQHPEPPLLPSADHIRSPNQMAVFKAAILIFSLVAKHNTNSGSCFNNNTAQVGSNRLVKTLSLGSDNAFEIEIGVCREKPIEFCMSF
jgi:hypothetical protein